MSLERTRPLLSATLATELPVAKDGGRPDKLYSHTVMSMRECALAHVSMVRRDVWHCWHRRGFSCKRALSISLFLRADGGASSAGLAGACVCCTTVQHTHLDSSPCNQRWQQSPSSDLLQHASVGRTLDDHVRLQRQHRRHAYLQD